MAGLVSGFDRWYESEPEEVSDQPTDDELAEYEEAEQRHHQQFAALEQQAARFSSSLGVGKLEDSTKRALRGFLREGIRFAFSTDSGGIADGLPAGARLAFLRVLSK